MIMLSRRVFPVANYQDTSYIQRINLQTQMTHILNTLDNLERRDHDSRNCSGLY